MKRSVASLVAGLLDFFWGAFLTSFCLRLPLLVMTVFVSALVLGSIKTIRAVGAPRNSSVSA